MDMFKLELMMFGRELSEYMQYTNLADQQILAMLFSLVSNVDKFVQSHSLQPLARPIEIDPCMVKFTLQLTCNACRVNSCTSTNCH